MGESVPAFFVSHGAPSLALDPDDATYRFFQTLGVELGKPKAVLAISAHWQTNLPCVSAVARPDTIHDFTGFPQPLYRMTYPAPGEPALARRIVEMLAASAIESVEDEQRGIDHGAWIPLMLMYPAADVPVVQLSVQVGRGAGHHYAVGKALRPLRDEGVLILASGGLTHNLAEVELDTSLKTLPMWAEEFRTWVVSAIESGRTGDLLEYRARAPHAHRNHPGEEHFLPLLVGLGAGKSGKRVHSDVVCRSLAMDAFRFD